MQRGFDASNAMLTRVSEWQNAKIGIYCTVKDKTLSFTVPVNNGDFFSMKLNYQRRHGSVFSEYLETDTA
jgi:hypothetical protein